MKCIHRGLLSILIAMLAGCGGGSDEPGNVQSLQLTDSSWVSDSGQTLQFKGLSAINGFAGCNSYLGQAVVDLSRINLKLQVLTTLQCSDALSSPGQTSSIMASELRFLDALQSTTQWRMDQDRLVLLDAQQAVLLLLKPKNAS